MSASLRKLGLTAHVLASVGWLGAVAAFLALAIVGLTSGNGPKAIAAYLAMDGITRSVIVPFCVASLITGIVQSLGTPWGLVRYYWVLLKLGLTVFGTVGLLLHTAAIRYAAGIAATGSFGADAKEVRVQLARVKDKIDTAERCHLHLAHWIGLRHSRDAEDRLSLCCKLCRKHVDLSSGRVATRVPNRAACTRSGPSPRAAARRRRRQSGRAGL